MLQDDQVYQSLNAQDKVNLWEQAICPGNGVSSFSEDILLHYLQIHMAKSHPVVLQCIDVMSSTSPAMHVDSFCFTQHQLPESGVMASISTVLL